MILTSSSISAAMTTAGARGRLATLLPATAGVARLPADACACGRRHGDLLVQHSGTAIWADNPVASRAHQRLKPLGALPAQELIDRHRPSTHRAHSGYSMRPEHVGAVKCWPTDATADTPIAISAQKDLSPLGIVINRALGFPDRTSPEVAGLPCQRALGRSPAAVAPVFPP